MVGEYRIRPLRVDEMSLPIEWARQEGWNPGLHDGECFYAADPEGFLVGELDGLPIGTVSGVAYDSAFGFLGFYIVKKEFREKGYGMPLAQATWEYLGDRNMGLDGVLERVEDYSKTGFKLAYRNLRYEGVGGGSQPPGLVPLGAVPFDRVLEYDRQCFPSPRRAFLEKWFKQPGAVCLAACEGESLRGYGVIRPCFHGHKIGPLFADSAEIAEGLYQGLSSSVPGQVLFLDTPEPNHAAISLAERHGMAPVFGTARMYSKGEPEIDLMKVFGVTSFELG